MKVGDSLPQHWQLRDQHGELVSLVAEGGVTLAYWYPKADTPGCTAQALSLRDQRGVFDDLGCRIVGLSFDDVDELAAFDAKYGLGFSLLSDSDRTVGRAFGVAGDDGAASYADRVAFLIDSDGVIVQRYEVDDPEFFADHVLDDLEEASS